MTVGSVSTKQQFRKSTHQPAGTVSIKKNPDYYRYFLPFVIILTAVVFSNTLGNYFVNNWDDGQYISDNEIVKHLNWENIRVMFSTFFHGNYHPLTLLSYAVEYKIFGASPFHFHFINYIFHLFNVVLVYVFLNRFTGKYNVAAIATLLFAIHPMHVESVAWISERKDVLYSFFFLLSLNSYAKYQQSADKKYYLVQSFLFFFLSLLSKPAAVCLPLALVLMDFYRDKKISWKTFTSKLFFFALSLLFGVVAIISQKATGAVQDIAPLFNIVDRFFLAGYSTVYYLFALIFPFNLCALHYYPIKSGGLLPLQYYLSIPALLVLVWGIYKSGKFKHELLFGLLFYFITLFMVLQIIPVGRAIVSERYSYIPSIGVFFIVGQLFAHVEEKKISFNGKIKNVLSFSILLFTLFFSFLTYQRNKAWKDSATLFNDVVKKYPAEGFGWGALAEAKSEKGDNEGALADFTTAIELNNKNPEAWFNRGTFDIKTNQFENAAADFTKAIQLKPNYYQAFSNRGLSFMNLKRMDESLNDFDKAIGLNPTFSDALFNRGNIFFEKQKFEKAIADYSSVILLNQYYVKAWYNRGISRFSVGDKAGACSDWQTARQLGHPQASDALQMYCR